MEPMFTFGKREKELLEKSCIGTAEFKEATSPTQVSSPYGYDTLSISEIVANTNLSYGAAVKKAGSSPNIVFACLLQEELQKRIPSFGRLISVVSFALLEKKKEGLAPTVSIGLEESGHFPWARQVLLKATNVNQIKNFSKIISDMLYRCFGEKFSAEFIHEDTVLVIKVV